jgi:hypothetical protein
VGDLVLAHIRKERFPRGTYNKLKMKKIRLCKIIRKFEANAYEIEFPDGVGISPIFNVADLYPYRIDEARGEEDQKEIQWVKQMLVAENPQMERIIDQSSLEKRPEGRNILSIWSNRRDKRLRMPVGKVKRISRNMERRCRSS